MGIRIRNVRANKTKKSHLAQTLMPAALFSREEADDQIRCRAKETNDYNGCVSDCQEKDKQRIENAQAKPATENNKNAIYPLTVFCALLSPALLAVDLQMTNANQHRANGEEHGGRTQ